MTVLEKVPMRPTSSLMACCEALSTQGFLELLRISETGCK